MPDQALSPIYFLLSTVERRPLTPGPSPIRGEGRIEKFKFPAGASGQRQYNADAAVGRTNFLPPLPSAPFPPPSNLASSVNISSFAQTCFHDSSSRRNVILCVSDSATSAFSALCRDESPLSACRPYGRPTDPSRGTSPSQPILASCGPRNRRRAERAPRRRAAAFRLAASLPRQARGAIRRVGRPARDR
jgi:hypothetical protein